MYSIVFPAVFYEYYNTNHKIKTAFVSPEGLKVFILKFCISISAESCLYYDAINNYYQAKIFLLKEIMTKSTILLSVNKLHQKCANQ